MNGNDSKVLVDLNAPTFQDDLFDLDVPDLKKVIKTLKKIRKMVWHDVFVDKGLHWEEICRGQVFSDTPISSFSVIKRS